MKKLSISVCLLFIITGFNTNNGMQTEDPPTFQVYINSITNKTKDSVQVSSGGEYVSAIRDKQTQKVRIPLTLIEDPVFKNPMLTSYKLEKPVVFFFRPRATTEQTLEERVSSETIGDIYTLKVELKDQTKNSLKLTVIAYLLNKNDKVEVKQHDIIPLEYELMNETFALQTKQVQIGIDLILKGNPADTLKESEIDLIPILKS